MHSVDDTAESESKAVGNQSPFRRRPYSRRYSSHISTHDLPLEKNAKGFFTAAGLSFFFIKLIVPIAYIYILLIILREIHEKFAVSMQSNFFLSTYFLPILSVISDSMQKSSLVVEVWVVIEALFYIYLKIVIQILQYKDPLEACLSAAPLMDIADRRECWRKMMDCITEDVGVGGWLCGWFFDCNLEDISRCDVMDYISWCMFEGRSQEHLTDTELEQIETFVQELEWRISISLYGISSSTTIDAISQDMGDLFIIQENPRFDTEKRVTLMWMDDPSLRYKPRKDFTFLDISDEEAFSSFFTNLFLSYKKTYEQYREKIESSGLQSVQNFRKYMDDKRQQMQEVEEHAKAVASNMYDNAYFTFVEKGSLVDKRLTAISAATHHQFTEAWNSLVNMKERLEIANKLGAKKMEIQNQLKKYHLMLDRTRRISPTAPSRQMADLLRNITKCNESLEAVETRAMNAFARATGFAKKTILNIRRDPKRFAKYSHDPLLGLATYPLAFHSLILLVTDGGLQLIMHRKGFVHLKIGSIKYYYHPGNGNIPEGDGSSDHQEDVPIIFCHGIGIGLLFYLPLIDELLKSGHPLLLPEIPYVCGFRPWQDPHSILTPSEVCFTLSAMITMNGYSKGVFIGHSYGSAWVSYMCKYASHVMAAVVFLDPICFCLHHPCLTKSFVYHRPDPGSVSYMVKTDVIVNWTIQRAFPWKSILLFTEDLPNIPCAIFLSELDVLVPIQEVERYLRSKGAVFSDATDVDRVHFSKGPINVTVFRGDAHGDWTERPSTAKTIAMATDILTFRFLKNVK